MPPRPRPRPRPVAKASSSTDPSSSNTGASSSSSSSIPPVKDSDDLFLRTGRTLKALKRIEKERPKTPSDDGSESETESPRRRKHKRTDKVPVWHNEKQLNRILSIDLSDSDDDTTLHGIENTPDRRKRQEEKNAKRAQQRERPITPPPELPRQQLLNAQALVQQALGGQTRRSPVSDESDDEFNISTDTLVLDPELARIAQNIKSQGSIPAHSSGGPSSSSDEEAIVLTVKWQEHPLNREAKEEESWVYKVLMTDSFQELFGAVADDAQILQQDLKITYRKTPVFSSATPKGLGLSGEADLVACHVNTYDYMQTQNKARIPQPSQVVRQSSVDDTGAIDLTSDTDDGDFALALSLSMQQPDDESDAGAESESEGDKFKLVLRSGRTTRDITLTVRSTTKCGAIVQAFLRKAGLADEYPNTGAERSPNKRKSRGGQPDKDPQLCIDGEKMEHETEIGEMDLEDGDMIEVVGL